MSANKLQRYCLCSEGMSDPPTAYESPTGDWVYACDAESVISNLEQQLAEAKSEIENLHLNLDDAGVPRDDGHENVYSINGRVGLLESAKKDQARYQWLRNDANSAKKQAPLVFFTDDSCRPTWENVLIGADLDESIDAAIKDSEK